MAKVHRARGAWAACLPCAEPHCAAATRAMEAAAGGASDVVEGAFWWSNCLQLRWMLWAMSHSAPELELHHDDSEHPADNFEWVMQARAHARIAMQCRVRITPYGCVSWHAALLPLSTGSAPTSCLSADAIKPNLHRRPSLSCSHSAQVLVPPLRKLEAHLFASLVAQLWRSAEADAAASEPAYGEAASARPSPPITPKASPGTPKASPRVRPPPSAEEAAVRRWLDGLQARARSQARVGVLGQALAGRVEGVAALAAAQRAGRYRATPAGQPAGARKGCVGWTDNVMACREG